MICPIDQSPLEMSERSGIEIDYCPQCRGVWLDRGEIDKIIERSVPAAPSGGGRYDDSGDYRAPQRSSSPQRRKENWLGELFG
jgi:Zn-finger nucleic acid-binding protein